MLELIGDYGYQLLAWVLAGLGFLLGKYVWNRIGHEYLRGVVSRAWDEVQAAVLEVAQTYTDAIKQAKADGKLTDEEKQQAKDLALRIAKSNIGTKGLRRLARVFDVDDWLATRVEAAVRTLPKPAPSEVAPEDPIPLSVA